MLSQGDSGELSSDRRCSERRLADFKEHMLLHGGACQIENKHALITSKHQTKNSMLNSS